MTYLYSNIDWKRVEAIGFDMDGTLYDEYEFITQPYKEICHFLSTNAYEFMCQRWLDKGSSYNKIFDESYDQYADESSLSKEEFINKSLTIFREYQPKLILSQRVKSLLDFFSKRYRLFLVSDGRPYLQKRKFDSLCLNQYFSNDNVVFTGENPSQLEKPKTNSLELLNLNVGEAIYFGDREKDREFAKNSGMQFQKVYNMINVGE